jgi:transcriptional regulator of met regulon
MRAEHTEDYINFKESKYSKMSDSAKSLIREFSGLPYKVLMCGTPVNGVKPTATHKWLQALDKEPTCKAALEEYVGQSIPDDQELISVLVPANFYNLS